MMSFQKGCGLVLSLLVLAVFGLLLTWPKAPQPAPQSYPRGQVDALAREQNAFYEYLAASEALERVEVDPATGLEVAWSDSGGLEEAMKHLHRGRAIRHFHFNSEADYPSHNSLLLQKAWSAASTALDKGNIEPLLDVLVAAGRLELGPGMSVYNAPQEAKGFGDRFPEISQRLLSLPLKQRLQLVQALDRTVNAQVPFTERLLVTRDMALDGYSSQLAKPPSGITGMEGYLEGKTRSALPKVKRYAADKYNGWIYCVRNGDLATLHDKAMADWNYGPPYGLSAYLWGIRFLITPARMSASLISFPLESFPDIVVDPLCEIAVGYSLQKLRWETLRLELAMSIYREKKGSHPRRLEDLVAEGILAQIPSDPFRLLGAEEKALPDSPLQFDGQKVWSVGWDGIDQRGAAELVEFKGLEDKGDFVVWRRAE